jgi:hypothetical protein
VVFKFVRRLLGRLRSSTTDVSRTSETTSATAVDVVFWGPSYDSFTNETSKWLGEMCGANTKNSGKSLIGPSVSRNDIEKLLNADLLKKSVAVFCGHGIDNALLGPPAGDGEDLVVQGAKHSKIYLGEMSALGPNSLFAFCCRAALKLGPAVSGIPARRFLGFAGDLPLNITNTECIQTWKSIVQKTVLQLLTEGQLSKTSEKALQQRYDQAYSYYSNGPGRKNDQALLMRAQVLRHKKLLRLYGGE